MEIERLLPLCPCGSGKRVDSCHLPASLRKARDPCDIKPVQPTSEYANPECYLSSTIDCSRKITREHPVSKGILREIGEIISVEGFAWLEPGEKREIPVQNLEFPMLCERHHKPLACLDRRALLFFRAIREFSAPAYSGDDRLRTFHGLDIERWMLKSLYGLLAWSSLQTCPGIKLKAKIDDRCVDFLFGRVPFATGRGLFVRTEIGFTIETKRQISASAVTSRDKKTINGIHFNMAGFDLLLSTSPIKVKDAIFQPSYVSFRNHTGLKVIHLSWPTPGAHFPVSYIERKEGKN